MTIQDIFAIRINHGYILQLFLAECLFFFLLKKRNHFAIRLVSSFTGFTFLSIILTNVVYYYLPGMNSFIIFLLSLVLGVVCFHSFKDVLYCFIGAQLLQNLSHNIEMVIYLPSSENINDAGWFFLSVGVMLIVYLLAYFFLIKQYNGKKLTIQRYSVVIFAFLTSLFCYLMQYMLEIYEINTIWVTCLPLLMCDALLIFLLFGLQNYKWKIDENAELERFIAKEDEHFQSLTANIDLINMKAHDLKHFILDLRHGKDLDDSELADIQEAVEGYELKPNTGCAPLDAILAEKMYLCSKYNIHLSLLVDGKELSFLKRGDIVSVFGNILSNAVEYEMTIEDKEKRYITLKVLRIGEIISIHAENYFVDTLEFQDNLPLTTKGSRDKHGYGLKSVKYIVEKHMGHLTIGKVKDTFCVDIIIPVPKAKK